MLVAGDMLSDVELPMPAADETLERYAVGLEALRDAVRAARALVPGHGTVTGDPRARYEVDMRYLDDLLAGRVCDDPRIQDPENAGLHAANLAKARAHTLGAESSSRARVASATRSTGTSRWSWK